MATNPWAAELARIQAEIKQQQAIIARDEAILAQAPGNTRLQQQIESARSYLAELQQRLDIVLIEYNNFAQQPVASSGAIVGNANQARDENANASRPVIGSQVLTPDKRIEQVEPRSGTNANPTPTSENTPTDGTNANLRPTSQTQAINNASNRATAGAGAGQSTADFASRDPRRTDLGGPGAGGPRDDNTPQTPNVVANTLNDLYSAEKNPIFEKPNVLDNYASYTYSISWYLATPTSYNSNIIRMKNPELSGYYLLAQSGGAGTAPGTRVSTPIDVTVPTYNKTYLDTVPGTTVVGASRNQYFNLDYYIDNLTMETAYPAGLDSGGPMAYVNVSFTISEPNGVTLPLNLYRAVNEIYSQTDTKSSATGSFINYSSVMYCLAIRFYGYNEAGQLVQPITNNIGSTDPNAAVEKFIFYQQTSLNYSVSSKLTEYRITGAVPSTNIGFSINRGSIPFNMQFTGTTVKDILVGQIKQQTASQAAGDNTRNDVPISSVPPVVAATGTDPNTINDQGMAFGGGGL